jgi:probable F420-dependent oxidoreductase
MQIGVHVANGGPVVSAGRIEALGVRAEELGFDSVWVSDHVVIPVQMASQYPYGPAGTFTADGQQTFFESFAVLAYLAGRTRRVRLGTGVLVLPQRQPLLVAKQWATLDALCGGRTILGVGAGWLREEFEALGTDTFDRRGLATDEAIRLYRAAWTQQGDVSFQGEVYRFEPLRLLPKPAQSAGPPIWVGGHGRRSIRRAAELGDGWYALRMGFEELRAGTTWLRELLERYGRQPGAVTVAMGLSAYVPGAGPQGEPQPFDLCGQPEQIAEKMRAYEAAGVGHAILQIFPRDSDAAMLEAVDFFGREVRPLLAS